MAIGIDITVDEQQMLLEALSGPILCDRDLDSSADELTRRKLYCCLNLCSRRLLQPATPRPGLRGWRGPTKGFLLTREGWSLLKATRRAARVGEAIARSN